MTRTKHNGSRPASSKRRNFVAVLISFTAISFLYFNFDPTPADADALGVGALTAVAPPPPLPSDSLSSSSGGGDASGADRSRMALLLKLLLLEKGHAKLAKAPDYTATAFMQERVRGTMGEEQVVQLKIRHEPFSVYMKWLVGDKGRELLYVKGRNDGDMLVHPGGWKARLVPALKLDPNGSLAMRDARYPVTMIGLLNMVGEMIKLRKSDLKNHAQVQCTLIDDQKFNERDCYGFVLVFADRKYSKMYRKCVVYIDKELSVPTYVRNYEWPGKELKGLAGAKLDEATMIEYYTYSKILLNQRMADVDFAKSNKQYQFRR